MMDLVTREKPMMLKASCGTSESRSGEKVGTESRSARVKGIKGIQNRCNDCDAS